MRELAPPLDLERRADARLTRIEQLSQQLATLGAVLRQELGVWLTEDWHVRRHRYAADELALALGESPASARRMVEHAEMYLDFPAVMARVGLPLADGGWTLRHADAVLDAMTGMGLSDEQRHAVVDLVVSQTDARTPYQLRKATLAAALLVDPEAAAHRFGKAREQRRVGVETFGDGSASFWAAGPVSQVAMVMASIDALAGPRQPGDTRGLQQRRFDALLDLVCGRAVPGQWQALLVVALETLEGGSAPAEIPGLGLVCAEEARELLGDASLRRAVVDEHGVLHSLDTHVHRPDSTPQPLDDPLRQLSLELEPEPPECGPDEPVAPEDRAWLAADLRARDVQGHLEALVARAMSTLEADLAELLRQPQLIPAGILPFLGEVPFTARHRPPPGSSNGGDDDGDDGGGGTGGSRPPDTGPPPPGLGGHDLERPPQTDGPPSDDDRAWAELTLDTDALDATEPVLPYRAEPETLGPTLPERTSSWTRPGLRRTLTTVLSAPLDPRPLSSDSYALPPRLARFIKVRDVTCTFPVCTLLARRCDNDHVVPWPQGPTTADNTSSECKHHHLAKHECFTLTKAADGTLTWTTPLGRTYLRRPRPLLRGW